MGGSSDSSSRFRLQSFAAERPTDSVDSVAELALWSLFLDTSRPSPYQ